MESYVYPMLSVSAVIINGLFVLFSYLNQHLLYPHNRNEWVFETVFYSLFGFVFEDQYGCTLDQHQIFRVDFDLPSLDISFKWNYI